MKIAFVCVNFNNSQYTKEFCESLLLQHGFDVDFLVSCIIVDNSSDVKDSDNIRKFSDLHDWIEYVLAPRNLGYFGGLNYGLEHIQKDENYYVVICNNDLTLDQKFCSSLNGRSYPANVYAICPDVVTADGFHQNPHSLKKINWIRRLQFDLYFSHYYVARLMSMVLRVFRPAKMSPLQPTVGCETHMGIGAIYILPPVFFQKFSKLNFPHFLYGEEAYFSDQIHAAGGILWFDPELRVCHAESATLSKMPKRTTYEFARSGYPSYRKML
jgi:glycosyltransferase involved in cell wall biosynthesis